jgi:hypothetical protein
MTEGMTHDDGRNDRSVIRKSLIRLENDAMTQMTEISEF